MKFMSLKAWIAVGTMFFSSIGLLIGSYFLEKESVRVMSHNGTLSRYFNQGWFADLMSSFAFILFLTGIMIIIINIYEKKKK